MDEPDRARGGRDDEPISLPHSGKYQGPEAAGIREAHFPPHGRLRALSRPKEDLQFPAAVRIDGVFQAAAHEHGAARLAVLKEQLLHNPGQVAPHRETREPCV